ncbi:hypothetical protein [Flagellimonas pacifica]|uniref:Four helix bundle protein n=1 Tax=Flagellimonas pacifica TaxID=1247520 RepID=A0A285MEP5_9FLAO|nr:hypothetical protein [Allomuricauda parva]SNY94436.1 hypothetical protein SAMN06265377_0094 [Allomuricauda parva]
MKEYFQTNQNRYRRIELKAFAERMSDSYGSPEELAMILDSGVEMLFYLEEDIFDRKKVQHVVSVLRDIVSLLRQQG